MVTSVWMVIVWAVARTITPRSVGGAIVGGGGGCGSVGIAGIIIVLVIIAGSSHLRTTVALPCVVQRFEAITRSSLRKQLLSLSGQINTHLTTQISDSLEQVSFLVRHWLLAEHTFPVWKTRLLSEERADGREARGRGRRRNVTGCFPLSTEIVTYQKKTLNLRTQTKPSYETSVNHLSFRKRRNDIIGSN